MGKVLQIRVMAYTYRPEDVEKRWPRLFNLAWPDADWTKPTSHGVMDLLERLSNESRLGDWSKELRKQLTPGIERAVYLKVKLEQALGDWDAHEANRLSVSLEEALDAVEGEVPED